MHTRIIDSGRSTFTARNGEAGTAFGGFLQAPSKVGVVRDQVDAGDYLTCLKLLMNEEVHIVRRRQQKHKSK